MSLWPKSSDPTEHKTRVLMLDDEKLLLMLFKSSFEKSGYEVVTFSDVETALSTLRLGYDPDVILFDITMPDDRSGYEFIETVRDEKLAAHSLKIALTNEAQEGEKARALELGADAHMQKIDYTPTELVAAITDMLKKKNS